MAVSTNVPPVTFGPNGFTSPSQADILAGVQADINAAFGGGLNPSLSTPQGQLASSLTALIGQANDVFVNITNQTNPDFATGIWQDAIGQIYFLQRNPSEPTVVQALCSGGAGVVVDVGALAQDAALNIYTCTAGTGPSGFPVGGSATLTFANNVPGPIPCPAGTLTTIYRSIPGWDTITNAADGILGNDTESAADFEARRAASVAVNALGTIPSVLGAVLNVTGVLDAYVTDNSSGSPVTIGGFTLAANSLYVAAVGGAQIDIATAIWSKKQPGCNYNGNTTVTVLDSRSGYSAPFPSYQVTFEIPPALAIMFAVNVANNSLVPANAATLIQNAIFSSFSGADGGTRARIGSTIYASRFYSAIAALGPWAQIISLLIGSANNPSSTFTGSIAGTTLTVTSVASGTIAIGQTISDVANGILPGTTITGGASLSWTVSVSQTVTSRTITGELANRTSIAVNINQVPTVNANNIVVTLT